MATAIKMNRTARTQLSVDFPRQGETISSPQYTFRICAPEGVQKVDVAIDDGDWQPCRQSVGYWWCDWADYGDGAHEITTRILTADGKSISSEPHDFFVQMGNGAGLPKLGS